MKEVVEDVYELKDEYWHLAIDALRNKDGTWEFQSFKWSDTKSGITAFSEASAYERGLEHDLESEWDDRVEVDDEKIESKCFESLNQWSIVAPRASHRHSL